MNHKKDMERMHQAIPVVKGIDHVLIRVDTPSWLFRFFVETLKLPVAWQISRDKYICTAGVFLGNVCIEIISYTSAPERDAPEQFSSASLFGIAFEPYQFTQALRQLAQRDFPHSSPIPYRGSLKPYRADFDCIPSPAAASLGWTMSILGGLLDGSTQAHYLGKCLSANKTIFNLSGEVFGSFSKLPNFAWYVNRAMGSSTFSLIEYPHDTNRLKLLRQQEFSAAGGGILGIKNLDEICIGVNDFPRKMDMWQKLMDPIQPAETGLWRMADGAAIRLVEHDTDEMVSLSFKVYDLPKARAVLADNHLLDRQNKDAVRLDPAAIGGLSIRLLA